MLVGRIEHRPAPLSDRSLPSSAAFSVLETTGTAPVVCPDAWANRERDARDVAIFRGDCLLARGSA